MKTAKTAKKKSASAKEKDADAVIIRMARKGAFSRIGEEAIKASHKLGYSATVLLDGGIYRLHPDGTRTLLKAV
jgi:hypothetical protein